MCFVIPICPLFLIGSDFSKIFCRVFFSRTFYVFVFLTSSPAAVLQMFFWEGFFVVFFFREHRLLMAKKKSKHQGAGGSVRVPIKPHYRKAAPSVVSADEAIIWVPNGSVPLSPDREILPLGSTVTPGTPSINSLASPCDFLCLLDVGDVEISDKANFVPIGSVVPAVDVLIMRY